MFKVKKVLCVFMVAVIAFSLSGCDIIERIDFRRINFWNNEVRHGLRTDDSHRGIPEVKPEVKPETADGGVSFAGNDKIIVIDPGHGKPSSFMSDDEKAMNGWKFEPEEGWGEWRHFKSGTMWNDCEGSGCSMRAPENGSCWYAIGNGDRDTEPEINYNNALNAKKYLEEMGYTVRLTRTADENPSLSQRLKKCYPDDDITRDADASVFVCLHSNAGGGSGSCAITLSGLYDQGAIGEDYIESGNELGYYINESIVENTSLSMYGDGTYDNYPELVLFCKSPVPVGYIEIGFYDNEDDLNILMEESDKIGKAVAEGINNYFNR